MDAKDYGKLFGLTRNERTTPMSQQNVEIESHRPKTTLPDNYRPPFRAYRGSDGTTYFYRGWISNREREMIIKNEHFRARS